MFETAKLSFYLRNGPLVINRQLLTEIRKIRKPCTIEFHFLLFSFAPTVLMRQIFPYCLITKNSLQIWHTTKYNSVYHAKRSMNCLVNYCSSLFRFVPMWQKNLLNYSSINREKMMAGVNSTCPKFRDWFARLTGLKFQTGF